MRCACHPAGITGSVFGITGSVLGVCLGTLLGAAPEPDGDTPSFNSLQLFGCRNRGLARRSTEHVRQTSVLLGPDHEDSHPTCGVPLGAMPDGRADGLYYRLSPISA
jgi:hypothetical protein